MLYYALLKAGYWFSLMKAFTFQRNVHLTIAEHIAFTLTRPLLIYSVNFTGQVNCVVVVKEALVQFLAPTIVKNAPTFTFC